MVNASTLEPQSKSWNVLLDSEAVGVMHNVHGLLGSA